ncbi:MAG: GDYXXLXY domain-containing protein [Desulfobacterales bacterium]
MRKLFIVLAVILQLVVLAYMAGEREFILHNGKVIHLRTAPIDPRDMFRGDYVRLNYEISRIPVNMIEGADRSAEIKKGSKIYVNLKEGPNGLYEPVDAAFQEPQEGLYLTGRIPVAYQKLQTGNPIWVKYGIEAYFVQQGKGREMEKRLGSRTDIQVPLEMEIAVGPNGKAVIKGYRWSPLGIGLQWLRRPPPTGSESAETPPSATFRLTLFNASDKPLAIVDLPNYCSFALEPVPWAKKSWMLAHDPCKGVIPIDFDVVTLAPEQQKRFEFDFLQERWLVEDNSIVKQIGTLDPSEQFRIVYRPPDKEQCRNLSRPDIIWHGYLASRVFHGRGQID